jgi:5-(carboxyamino)imidazole ribonucleotide synthase
MAEPKIAGPLPPGSTVGILGGGQLGRMLAIAAAGLGFRCHVYCPDDGSPAFHVTDRHTRAAYSDAAALETFARSVDVVTYEFENVPFAAAAALAKLVTVEPKFSVLEIAQDRSSEKTYARNLGLPVAGFAVLSSLEELDRDIDVIGIPAVLKTRRMGYDGKGQFIIRRKSDTADAWRAIGGKPAILESMVPFAAELSVIVARGRDGALRIFDIVENHHRNHILATSKVPAAIDPSTAQTARHIASTLAHALSYVGVLAVELFLLRIDGSETLLINEIAPRVHNSGHWTQDACQHSQFELHIRAIAGWPLPDVSRHCDVEMMNLIGDDVHLWSSLAAESRSSLHLYGKDDVRPGRKMGHVNRLKPRLPGPSTE